MNLYETDRLLTEYLLFHYAAPEVLLPWPSGPREALGFAVRAVSETFGSLPAGGRALDIGCAVGRSSFELARRVGEGGEVVGIDFSHSFIEAAKEMRDVGSIVCEQVEEGARVTRQRVEIPPLVEGEARGRIEFQQGDAMVLPESLGVFDAVLAANLICRLTEPKRFLAQLPGLVRPGGALVITTPCTWMEEFTPRAHWLGGIECEGVSHTTLEGLREALDPAFVLERTLDLPFLIREHARKYQWSVAQASVWTRRS